ncbi:MAG: addiction module toxin RelE [Hyphomicrobiales bacterium]|jgi:hypothetical protein|nr:addiction module toxin RelE [Hyphomicrobiales bacterium]
MSFVRTVWPTIIELPGFVRDVAGVLNSAECMELGVYLARQPQCGDVIPGGKGLRKVRWMARQRGKRGGARVIYFYRMPDDTIFLMAAYAKSEREDMTPDKKRELVAMAEALATGGK